jgi:lipopolysaccharide transport system ATP-binding protein
MKPAIVVENLGKRYRVDHAVRQGGYKTMRETLTRLAAAPLKRLRGGETGAVEDFWALKDVSFEVQPGEVLGIIGRNGAGKSTLLKILSRITKPTTGQVRLNGRVASLLEVGTGFHPELTGRENIFLNGSILGMSRKEIVRQFDAIVDFSGVEKFLDTPVKRYSSGMYVRLAFAVAAHLQPEILIVDEVLAVGDAQFQKKCIGKMQEVARGGRTVLFVSHNMASIEKLCETAIILRGGQIAAKGETPKMVGLYLSHMRTEALSRYAAPNQCSRPACLMEAELLNVNEVACNQLRFGEPFWIRMHWKHNNPVPAIAYAVRVFDDYDRLLFAVNTLDHDELCLECSGDHIVTCGFPNNILPPGRYRVAIGAWVRPHTEVQVIEDCIAICVDTVPFASDHRFEIVGSPAAAVKVLWKKPYSGLSGKHPGLLEVAE